MSTDNTDAPGTDAAAELADFRRLFDMQWTRTAEATERWRAENPAARALTMPDLGDLLAWLMADADRARAQLAEGARAGYEQAIATLSDIAGRTGSRSARYWADYLTTDPDRLAPPRDPAGDTPRSEYQLPELSTTGVLWLINRVVFHPRGYALYLHRGAGGAITGWGLQGNGTDVWRFADEDAEDRHLADVEALFAAHRVVPTLGG